MSVHQTFEEETYTPPHESDYFGRALSDIVKDLDSGKCLIERCGLKPDFVDRVQSRVEAQLKEKQAKEALTVEAQKTEAFKDFFVLVSKLAEAGTVLDIKSAVLDMESGEVTVSYRTRPAPVLKDPDSVPHEVSVGCE